MPPVLTPVAALVPFTNRINMNFAQFVIIFSHLPILITSVYAALIYKKLGNELKVFSIFLFLSCILQGISLVLWFKEVNNLPVLHIYVVLGFINLAWFYNTLLADFINKRVIWISTLVFTVFSVLNSLFVQPVFKFNSNAVTLQSILIIILSLSTYMLLLNKIVKEKRKDVLKSFNWINSGLFIYYSSTLIIFFFGNLITHRFSMTLNLYAWLLHSFFSVIMYCCFFIGLWKRPKI